MDSRERRTVDPGNACRILQLREIVRAADKMPGGVGDPVRKAALVNCGGPKKGTDQVPSFIELIER
jgi:hypothetical protein